VFTARYALSSYIKQIRFVFKGLRGQTELITLLHSNKKGEGLDSRLTFKRNVTYKAQNRDTVFGVVTRLQAG
jgi:hypothetical protein